MENIIKWNKLKKILLANRKYYINQFLMNLRLYFNNSHRKIEKQKNKNYN